MNVVFMPQLNKNFSENNKYIIKFLIKYLQIFIEIEKKVKLILFFKLFLNILFKSNDFKIFFITYS